MTNPNQTFGNYRTVALLGEGGFGAVYLVEHPLVHKRAAAKVLHASLAHDPELVSRFFNEARAATAIAHPNIVEVFDAGLTPDGTPYILMELLGGEPLRTRMDRQRQLATSEAVELVHQIGIGLAAAHDAGIVHRDLKPENLFIVPDPRQPGHELIKILDFGIAKLNPGLGGAMVKTQTGQFMGSPPYMSPEQWAGLPDIDRRTDIYALGIILYEMLAGTPPFVAQNVFDARDLHLRAPVPPLHATKPDIPQAIVDAITGALKKDRDERWPDMHTFLTAIAATGATGAEAAAARTSIRPTAIAATAAMPSVATANEPRPTTTLSASTGAIESDDSDLILPITRRPRWLWPMAGLAAATLAVLVIVLEPPAPTPDDASRPRTATPLSAVAQPGPPAPVARPDAGIRTPHSLPAPRPRSRPADRHLRDERPSAIPIVPAVAPPPPRPEPPAVAPVNPPKTIDEKKWMVQ